MIPALQCAAQARQVQQILDLARRLILQRDLLSAEAACRAAIHELTDCDRAYCLFYDAQSGALWSETQRSEDGEDDRCAARGLAGFAARSRAPGCVQHASGHPCYARDIDDPPGKGDERLLTQPVIGSDGQAHAVLIAVRSGRRAPFSTAEQENLGLFAGQAGPLLEQLGLHLEAEALLEAENHQEIFRREALEAYAVRGRHGDVIRISPRWVDWAYWLIVAVVAAALAYTALAQIARYSSGPAVVRVANRSEVTAHLGATVAAVAVASGQRVEAGQLLARFHDAEQRAAVELLEQEFATQLRNRLLEPFNKAADEAVRSLRVELDRARPALEERTVRAPHAGIVSDVRVRSGQHVTPGDILLSIIDADSERYIVALLPGGDRPQLAPGLALRLEVTGYRYAYQTLTIDAVAAEVIGPAEARRFLGPQVGDILTIDGPVVLVRARLPSREFEADGRRYDYHDGMQATAQVRVRSQSLLKTLLPQLRGL